MRKKRDVEERWTLGDDVNKAFHGLYWAHARWTREEIGQNGSAQCDRKAMRFYKRLDRLRHIAAWQFCDKVDSYAPFCSWAYGAKPNGELKGNPRYAPWLNKKFGFNKSD